jgi:hypothetical protein
MNRKLLLLVLSCCMTAAYAANQQVYKWTDAAGVTHFSDAPPPKDAQNVQLIRVSGNDRPHSIEATNSEPGSQPADDPDNPGGAAAAADKPGDASAKACAGARNNLDLLNSKVQVSVMGADGKPQPLNDKTRAAEIAAANAQIAAYCK